METSININKLNIYNTPEQFRLISPKKLKTSPNKDSKFVKTNLYLNDYNYYFKNNIKMNKWREEKLKEKKRNLDKQRKKNNLPKLLYFNKFLDNDINISKSDNNSNGNSIGRTKTLNPIQYENAQYISPEKRQNSFKEIENAIIAHNIEENSKSHIKKTIKMFDDLLEYVDDFRFQKNQNNTEVINDNDKKSEIKNINEKDDNNDVDIKENSNDNIEKDNDNKDNKDNEEEELKVEKFDYEEYKKQYKSDILAKKNSSSQTPDKPFIFDKALKNNNSKNFQNNEDFLYITEPQISNKINLKSNIVSNEHNKLPRPKRMANSVDKNSKNIENDNFKINNMTLISDDALIHKIKNIGRDFKNDLYFKYYGKYKFTDLGLNYPEDYDKYKKIPDYKGDDIEEKKVFKYRTDITNPRYNYYNIGSFNEKFNKDLSDISSFYGKEQSKGRFIRNPLVSIFTKNIPNYEQYKQLKLIENKYNPKNKYKFRLKPLTNSKKNNFDKLANNVYEKENKTNFFLL